MKIKLPRLKPGCKLKDADLHYRVLLRLVRRHNQRMRKADLKEIVKDMGADYDEAAQAMLRLISENIVTVKPITESEFEFELCKEAVAGSLNKDARSYQEHLEARARREANKAANPNPPGHPKSHGPTPPPHLPPVTADQRAPYMEIATRLAEQLGRPLLVTKIANCIARIGEADVEAAVQEALKTFEPGGTALSRIFFTVYETRRERLIPTPT